MSRIYLFIDPMILLIVIIVLSIVWEIIETIIISIQMSTNFILCRVLSSGVWCRGKSGDTSSSMVMTWNYFFNIFLTLLRDWNIEIWIRFIMLYWIRWEKYIKKIEITILYLAIGVIFHWLLVSKVWQENSFIDNF